MKNKNVPPTSSSSLISILQLRGAPLSHKLSSSLLPPPPSLPSSSSHSFMASKLLRGHRMKPKVQKKTDDEDVLAIEKAAAWAWYQRGSGSEGKAMMRESRIVARTPQRDHRPSRYKLEAMRMSSSPSPPSSQETKEVGLSNKSLPLLDEYEVSSILTRLDSLIAESSSDDKLDNGFGSANGDQRTMLMKKKQVGRKGMWERRRVRVICSTRKEDVVEYGRRRRRDCKESHHQIQPSASTCSRPRANNGGGRRVM